VRSNDVSSPSLGVVGWPWLVLKFKVSRRSPRSRADELMETALILVRPNPRL
jgi:hypothetical protein